MSNAGIIRVAQYDGGRGLSTREAITSANLFNRHLRAQSPDARFVLLPNKSTASDLTHGFDGRLVESNIWRRETQSYPANTGTFILYGKADSPLPKIFEYTDPHTKEKYVFPDTGDATGRKNVLLAANYGLTLDGQPLIQLHEDKNRIRVEITDPKQIVIIENFPKESDYYSTDPVFGIPAGEKMTFDVMSARYLCRSADERIGLVVRGYGGHFALSNEGRRSVGAVGMPSSRHGVLGLVTNATPEQVQFAARETVDELRIIGMTVPHGFAELALKPSSSTGQSRK